MSLKRTFCQTSKRSNDRNWRSLLIFCKNIFICWNFATKGPVFWLWCHHWYQHAGSLSDEAERITLESVEQEKSALFAQGRMRQTFWVRSFASIGADRDSGLTRPLVPPPKYIYIYIYISGCEVTPTTWSCIELSFAVVVSSNHKWIFRCYSVGYR